MSNIRYVLKYDDEGHTYIVPLINSKLFDRLLSEGYENDDFTKFDKKFGSTRCDGRISFTDPKEL